jgi:hypothetical protein
MTAAWFFKEQATPLTAMAASAYLPEGETASTPVRTEKVPASRVSKFARCACSEGRLAELVDRCLCTCPGRKGAVRGGYEVLNEVVLNQVLVSFGSPDFTRRVIAGIQQDGVCWCGGTEWQGRTGMRISISSWATTDEDIDKSLESI